MLTKIRTSGDGVWSNVSKEVVVTKVTYDSEFDTFDIYFDTKTWNVKTDGLIYTDGAFRDGMCEYLRSNAKDLLGLMCVDWRRLQYTEQGMQGPNWVSMELI